MTVLDAVKGRFSTRSYENRPVDDKDLTIVLESARYAQSAKNLQDWKFVVVKDADTRSRLMDAAKGQRHVAQAPVVIACCGINPNYVMTCGQYSYSLDVAIATENMALTAHELGLGTCWLGAFHEDMVKEILGIPKDEVRVVGLLTLGYPATSAPVKNRKPIEEIVSWERW